MKVLTMKSPCKLEAEFIAKCRVYTKMDCHKHKYHFVYNTNGKLSAMSVVEDANDFNSFKYYIKGYDGEGNCKLAGMYVNMTRLATTVDLHEDKLNELKSYVIVYGDGNEDYEAVGTLLREGRIELNKGGSYTNSDGSTLIVLYFSISDNKWIAYRFSTIDTVPSELTVIPISIESLFFKLNF